MIGIFGGRQCSLWVMETGQEVGLTAREERSGLRGSPDWPHTVVYTGKFVYSLGQNTEDFWALLSGNLVWEIWDEAQEFQVVCLKESL